MPFYLLVAILPAIAAFASGSVALYAWQRREVNGAKAFSLCTGSIFIWCFFAVFEYLSLDQTARIILGKAEYFGISFFPALWLIFTLRYAQYDRWLSPQRIVAITIVPMLTLTFALTDYWHGLIWRSAILLLEPYPRLVIEHGWWFNHVTIPHCYTLLVVGFGVLLSASFSRARLYQQQTFMLVGAAIAPFAGNVLYVVAGIKFYGLDLTPVGFALTGVLIHLSLFRTKFLEVAPISYRTVFLNTADAVILLDIRRRIVDLNPSALAEGGNRFDVETAVGQPLESLFPLYSSLLQALGQKAELTQTMRLPDQTDDRSISEGPTMFRQVKVRSLLNASGRQIGWTIIIRDVTLEKQEQTQLEALAYVDSLTGLFNRRHLELTAEKIFAARADGTLQTPVALLYVDLNRFKLINDDYGHEVGDAVLQHFAQCLENSVRQGDVVARLGGDEFVALLYGADREVALEVRSRLVKTLNQAVLLAGHRFTLSASIGFAYYPTDGVTLRTLLRQADQHMYGEKQLIQDA